MKGISPRSATDMQNAVCLDGRAAPTRRLRAGVNTVGGQELVRTTSLWVARVMAT